MDIGMFAWFDTAQVFTSQCYTITTGSRIDGRTIYVLCNVSIQPHLFVCALDDNELEPCMLT